MEKILMTPGGRKLLEEELKRLIQVERPNIIRAIEEARSHGDLSENAEYHAAKEQQSFIEGRIAQLRGKLATAEVVNPQGLSSTKVMFGATVTLEDQETGTQTTYQIVGSDEANIKLGKLNYQSPFGRKLIGRSVNDEIEQETTKGIKTWIIRSITYP